MKPLDLVIVGGGITGLSAAYYAQKKALSFKLLEKSPRLGGKIHSEYQNGFLLEWGADSFITTKPHALELAHELGLEQELLPTKEPRTIFVLKNKRLIPLPEGVSLVIPTALWPFVTSPLFSPMGKLRMGMDLLLPRKKHPEKDESVADFILRRLGREALDLLAEPMMSGIYNTNPYEQSLLATFPQLLQLEQQHRTLIGGMLKTKKKTSRQTSSLFISFRGGMGTLVDALEKQVRSHIHLEGVKHLHQKEDGVWEVHTPHTTFLASRLLLTLPPQNCLSLLEDKHAELKHALRSFHTHSSAAVYLAYPPDRLTHLPRGFGVIIPKTEKRPISAITFVHDKLSHRVPSQHSLLRVFFGHGKSGDFEKMAREEVKNILGIQVAPLFTHTIVLPFSSPQYPVGHLEKIQQLSQISPPHIFFAGCAYKGVGIPDCIKQAKDCIELLHGQPTSMNARIGEKKASEL